MSVTCRDSLLEAVERFGRRERIYPAAGPRKQANHGPKLFWWYNMYAPVDWSVTPRPATGRRSQGVGQLQQPAELKDRCRPNWGVPPDEVLGADGRHRQHSLDADATIRILDWHRPFPDPRLPAAPGLQPATAWPGDPGITSDWRRLMRRGPCDDVAGNLGAEWGCSPNTGSRRLTVRWP
ncbi:MAG: hypothetical protein CM1200mP2_50540 [Planctomycetaceae bacterium]|nr:MAG: hypothetical protein CM1200mP2_50540 [Planctomycetaceae bacterium]